MSASIKTRLVKIGNSQGVRIPKVLLEQVGLTAEVELEVQGDHLVLRSARRPREGWEEQFRQMAEHGDDALVDQNVRSGSSWDEKEWTWE